MTDSFESVWLDEFTESTPRAIAEGVVLLATGGASWYAWAVAQGTTKTQVFVWMTLFAVGAISVVWFHARRIWKREQTLRLTADERYMPRPILKPQINEPMSGNFVPSRKDEPFVVIENRGDLDAVNLSLEPIYLKDTSQVVEFTDDAIRDGVRAKGEILTRPSIHSVDDMELSVHRDVVHAVTADYAWGAAYKTGRDVHEWPMRLTYEDLHGRTFETIANLHLDIRTRRVSIRFVSAGLVKRLVPATAILDLASA